MRLIARVLWGFVEDHILLLSSLIVFLYFVVFQSFHDDLEGRPFFSIESLIKLWNYPDSNMRIIVAPLLKWQHEPMIVEPIVSLYSLLGLHNNGLSIFRW